MPNTMGKLYGRDEVAWLAGFFEGEGSTGRYRQKSGTSKNVWGETKTFKRYGTRTTATIYNTDYETLDHAQNVLELGTIYGPYTRGQVKPRWVLTYYGFEQVQALFAMIYPWLSQRRRAQFIKALYEPLES